jgi:hypothetical protein
MVGAEIGLQEELLRRNRNGDTTKRDETKYVQMNSIDFVTAVSENLDTACIFCSLSNFNARVRIAVFGFGSATRSARIGRSSAHKSCTWAENGCSPLGPLFVHKNNPGNLQMNI